MVGGQMSQLEINLRARAVAIVFNFEERWLEFFFSHKVCELRLSPGDLLREANCFNRSERILVKVALDLWTGRRYVSIGEVVEVLDFDNFVRVILAAITLREVGLEDLDDMRSRYEA